MNWFAQRICEVQLAFMLLTRLPVGRMGRYVPNLSSARWAFPLAGIPIGIFIAGLFFGFCYSEIPHLLGAVITLSISLLLTGALHEDGLADTADGFGGGTTRKQKLKIMGDSNVGTYGLLCLILTMIARVFYLSSMNNTHQTFLLLISISMISRLTMVFYLNILPPARSKGLGYQASGRNYLSTFFATVISLPAIIYCGYLAPNCLLAVTIVAITFAYFAKSQIKGQTGDICGASQLLCETTGWIAIATISSVGL